MFMICSLESGIKAKSGKIIRFLVRFAASQGSTGIALLIFIGLGCVFQPFPARSAQRGNRPTQRKGALDLIVFVDQTWIAICTEVKSPLPFLVIRPNDLGAVKHDALVGPLAIIAMIFDSARINGQRVVDPVDFAIRMIRHFLLLPQFPRRGALPDGRA